MVSLNIIYQSLIKYLDPKITQPVKCNWMKSFWKYKNIRTHLVGAEAQFSLILL
jgi:hypothetical protein